MADLKCEVKLQWNNFEYTFEISSFNLLSDTNIAFGCLHSY